MKIVLPSFALVLLACSTSAPNKSSEPSPSSASVGSSAEALRKLGQLDADDVQKCRAVAERCAGGDAGANPICERIDEHCDQLEAQLAADRTDLQQCLERAAACEAAATDPADCAEERAACEPADGDHRARRGQTMQCAGRAESCLGNRMGGRFGFGFGFGRRGGNDEADAGDAGAGVCQAGDDDFVGCCRGHHGNGADAGAPAQNGGFGRGRGGFGQGGFDRDRGRDQDRDRDAADAGAPGPRPGAPFRRNP